MITPEESYPALAKAIGTKELRLKREDLHPLGSHKGRSIPVMIDRYSREGERDFAISSSGNAALSAALYLKSLNNKLGVGRPYSLDIFVGNNINRGKLEKLKVLTDENIRVLTKERPLQALAAAVSEGKRSLRQSTDDTALLGYKSLAEEIALSGRAGAVFMATSSGTTAQALCQHFMQRHLPIQVHIVQTSSCHPIADAFDNFDLPDERSIADAIVDQTAHRKDALVPMIKKTGGNAWCANNDEITCAISLLAKHADLKMSPNSALALAGAMRAIASAHEFGGACICVMGGE